MDSTPYDRVPYPTGAFSQTHPAAMETLAALRGLDPAPAGSCRVLELGCGSGGNLIPMAHQYPASSFVGIDLSQHAVAEASRTAAGLGLENIELKHQDILDFPRDSGAFDYIIVHGVYSWVPPVVRSRILEIFGRHLAPHGIGYVSFNSLPGSHLRNIARDIMLFHSADEDGLDAKSSRAVASLRAIVSETNERELYGVVLRTLLRDVEQRKPEVLYHDDLNPNTTPFLFHQVVDEAGRHGLQFLAEAGSAAGLIGPLDPLAKVLDRISGASIVSREQDRDFLLGRGFRSTLFCHADPLLRERIEPDAVTRYFIASMLRPAAGEVDPASDEVVSFDAGGEPFLSTDHRLTKAALLALDDVWPRALRFDDLVRAALDRLGPAAADIEKRLPQEARALATVLLQTFAIGGVLLRRAPLPGVPSVSRTPQASLLARRQAAQGSQVTNLLHRTVGLEDPIVRGFLQLLDGTRTVEQLTDDLRRLVSGHEADGVDELPSSAETMVTREAVERNLRHVARLALLVA